MLKIRRWIADHPDLSFLLSSGLIAILAYGLYLSVLGMYGDDPNFLWAYHRGGAAEYKAFMGWIRDFGYLIYQYLSPILGETILPWRICTLILRWSAAFLFQRTLRRAFPSQTRLIFTAGFLFLLYPGFLQQAIPVEFILHFLSLNLIFGGLLVSQYMAQDPRRRWWAALPALLLETIGIFICEYFIGLALLRPVLIWQELTRTLPNQRQQKIKKVKTTLLLWLPHLLLFVFFIYWRATLSTSTYMESVALDRFSADPAGYLLSLLTQAVRDLKLSAVDAWLTAFRMPTGGLTLALYLIIVIGTFLLLFGLLKNSQTDDQDSGSEKGTLFWIGVCFVFIGGLPVWGAGLTPTLTLFWDRLTLPFMWGACLMLAALIVILARPKYQSLLLALLIAVLAGNQFQIQNQFKREWTLIQNYFWQLSWRAPDIAADTLIIGDNFPFNTLTDNSLTALLNWNYEQEGDPEREAYKFFQASNRIGTLDNAPAASQITHNNFKGSASDALILYGTPSTCLKLLTEDDLELPFLGVELKRNLWRSNPEQVIAAAERTIKFQPFMGKEPAHNWCYSYEKAELAAQQGDWEMVLALGEAADSAGLQPATMIEMKSFLFAALITDRIELAERWATLVTAEKGNADWYLHQISVLRQQKKLSQDAEEILADIEDEFQQEKKIY